MFEKGRIVLLQWCPVVLQNSACPLGFLLGAKKSKNFRQVALTTENWMITFGPGWKKWLLPFYIIFNVTY
jgi:hypothetical protein